MPNLIMEYSDALEGRLNIHSMLQDMHQIMIDSDLFECNSIRSRTLRTHLWLIGESEDQHNFIHISIELIEGRTPEQKKALSDRIFQLLVEQANWVGSLSVDVRDMDQECFNRRCNTNLTK
ncbi:5-carboxymethyl-2-hydroxymuconate Delta-isomerase [Vibrio ezurae]|uniref:Putative 5-carboxymethyl-2-hydroxymuconate isomerase n=1 Tax=Vibrio ezurae NBRC 102218 TaxID=1219080 RepID=U3CIB1_9VIBR|nr:5-carboxymethyl-2-hydroxymuconate Delta-isomerase [Vibrio ezurae]GAD80899.1 putative 5-carboxymethyl-2-hydroxymuconate isomerase [Vibrio ezurae NBRC 102218]